MWSAADIVNASLAGVGLLAAGGGLWFAYKAFGAAQTASKAAREARDKIAQRVTAADLGSIRTALRATLERLRDGDTATAWSDCQNSREYLMELRARPGLEDQQPVLTGAITGLARVQERLVSEEPTNSETDTIEVLQAVLETVVGLQQHALFFEGEANSHEQSSD